MSNTYLACLTLVVVGILASRMSFAFLPVRRIAVRTTAVDAALFVIGVIGLGLHCGAMFFRSEIKPWPGATAVIRVVDPLGTASIVWFAVAAAVVLIGLRHQHFLAVAVVAPSLAAVGLTMYDGGSLRIHLTAIFVSVVVLAVAVSGFVLPPWQGRRPLEHSDRYRFPA